MPRVSISPTALPTTWDVPDELWDVIRELVLEYDPPKSTGRKRIDPRRALAGILFRRCTGCHWNALPKEFGDDSSVHRTFRRWQENGLLDQVWALLPARFQTPVGMQALEQTDPAAPAFFNHRSQTDP